MKDDHMTNPLEFLLHYLENQTGGEKEAAWTKGALAVAWGTAVKTTKNQQSTKLSIVVRPSWPCRPGKSLHSDPSRPRAISAES